jgi:hypothetical protein
MVGYGKSAFERIPKMFVAESASGWASARILSSASLSVWAARRAISRNMTTYGVSRGSARMYASIVASPTRRSSGSM